MSISHLIDSVDIASSVGTPVNDPDDYPDEIKKCFAVEKTNRIDGKRQNQHRFRCKRYIITWSQVDVENTHHSAWVHHLKDNLKMKIRLTQETHKNGGIHYHAYAEFPDNRNIRNMEIFNVENHHPNFKPVNRTPHRVWSYIAKNIGKGDHTGRMLHDDWPEPPQGRRKAKLEKRSDVQATYAKALRADSKKEALKIIKDERPGDYWTRCQAIQYAADKEFGTDIDTTYGGPSLEELGVRWDHYPELERWVGSYLPSVFTASQLEECGFPDGGPPSLTPDNSSMSGSSDSGRESQGVGLGRPETPQSTWDEYVTPSPVQSRVLSAAQPRPRPKTLVLWGPTRTGKTLFARALGRHIYHSGKFNVNVCTPDVDFCIFDDLKDGFHTPNFDYKAWMGGQHEFTLDGKWVRETRFVWDSKPCIYICNRDPFDKDGVIKGVDYDWIKSNSITVEVREPLHRMALDHM